MLFLKKIEEAGKNIHLDKDHKKLLNINDDLDIAIRDDLMSE